jgi:hypothetical protein
MIFEAMVIAIVSAAGTCSQEKMKADASPTGYPVVPSTSYLQQAATLIHPLHRPAAGKFSWRD